MRSSGTTTTSAANPLKRRIYNEFIVKYCTALNFQNFSSGLDDDDLRKQKNIKGKTGRGAWGRGKGCGSGGGGGAGGCIMEQGAAEEADVEAMYSPDQRRPSDAEPPGKNSEKPKLHGGFI
jgi:hypothetical protein